MLLASVFKAFDPKYELPASEPRGIKPLMSEASPRSRTGHLVQPPNSLLPLERLCRNWQNYAHWCFCHSGLDPESSFFKMLRYWMPDQVRHDRYKLNAF